MKEPVGADIPHGLSASQSALQAAPVADQFEPISSICEDWSGGQGSAADDGITLSVSRNLPQRQVLAAITW
jgi:hypothetical protein